MVLKHCSIAGSHWHCRVMSSSGICVGLTCRVDYGIHLVWIRTTSTVPLLYGFPRYEKTYSLDLIHMFTNTQNIYTKIYIQSDIKILNFLFSFTFWHNFLLCDYVRYMVWYKYFHEVDQYRFAIVWHLKQKYNNGWL